MLIRCPQCGYERDMPADRVPDGVVVASCPQCACRFQFSKQTGSAFLDGQPGEPGQASQPRWQGSADAAARQAAERSAASGSAQGGTPAQAAPQGALHEGDDPLPPGAVVMDPLEPKEPAAGTGHGLSGASRGEGGDSALGAGGSLRTPVSSGSQPALDMPDRQDPHGSAGQAAPAGVSAAGQQDAPQKKASRLEVPCNDGGQANQSIQPGLQGNMGQQGMPGARQDGTPDAWGGQPGQQGQLGQSGQQNGGQQEGWHQGPETWGDIPEEDEAGYGLPNPWDEAPRPSGWLSAFYQTCIRAMFAPARFFSSLTPRPVLKALAFYLLVCALQLSMQQVWSQVFLSYIQPLAGSDPQLQKMAEALAGQDSFALSLILRLAALTLQIYIFAGLLTLAWRIIAPGRANYTVVFQVLAYAEAPGLLCLVPAIGALAGLVWGFACMLIGARAAFGLTWGQTLLGFLPLVLLLLPSLMQVTSLLGM